MLRLSPELTTKYPSIPAEAVCDAIELAAIKTVTTCLGISATACVDEDGFLHVHLLKGGKQEELQITGLKRNIKRRLLDEVELELMKRQAWHEARKFNTIRGSAVAGTIDRIREDGTLVVLIELIDLLTPIVLYAECPVAQQPVPERGRYQKGDVMDFFVSSCTAISNSRHAKVRIIVSRTARELPSRLLMKLTGLPGIRCIKRIPGGESRIITPHWIPNKAIVTVGQQLREHLSVEFQGHTQAKKENQHAPIQQNPRRSAGGR